MTATAPRADQWQEARRDWPQGVGLMRCFDLDPLAAYNDDCVLCLGDDPLLQPRARLVGHSRHSALTRPQYFSLRAPPSRASGSS